MTAITFLPDDQTVKARPGERIIDIARKGGVGLKAECGGRGKCGTCRVEFESEKVLPGTLSELSPAEEELLPESREGHFFRLACFTKVYGDVTVTIPPETRVTRVSPPKPVTKYKIPIEPAVERLTVILDEAEEHSPTRPLTNRIQSALFRSMHKELTGPDLRVMADFSRQPKAGPCREITATVFQGHEIIQLRPDAYSDVYGVALDLGTTSLAAFLCDLKNDRIVAARSLLNPQVAYGEDVISRIAHIRRSPSELPVMQELLVEGVNHLIRETAFEAGISRDDILDVVAVGNPTMQHLFLGLDPSSLGEAPYLPLCYGGGEVEVRQLDLYALPSARIHVLPMLSGFIGGDTLGALLTRSTETFKGSSLVVDVGTNGELVLTSEGVMTATSCATGPVFEGAQIQCGMRATPGAIDKVWMDEKDETVCYHVIPSSEGDGVKKPTGFCGSGVISAVSTLVRAGIIKKSGAYDMECGFRGLRTSRQSGKPEVVIVPSTLSSTGRDVVLTQDDIRAVQLGKAALRAGVEILMKHRKISHLDKVFLAGTFGNYLDPAEVLNIGMLPPIGLESIESIGNAAGDGARLALFSMKKRQEAVELAGRIEVVELSMRSDFQEVFVGSMEF